MELIYSYIRKQAIEDGEQMLLTDELASLGREVGYKYPIYVTSGVWDLVQKAVESEYHLNDVEGVVWDILYMAKTTNKEITESLRSFQVIITGTGRKRYHQMLIQCGPVDIGNPEPCLTIMLPEEN